MQPSFDFVPDLPFRYGSGMSLLAWQPNRRRWCNGACKRFCCLRSCDTAFHRRAAFRVGCYRWPCDPGDCPLVLSCCWESVCVGRLRCRSPPPRTHLGPTHHDGAHLFSNYTDHPLGHCIVVVHIERAWLNVIPAPANRSLKCLLAHSPQPLSHLKRLTEYPHACLSLEGLIGRGAGFSFLVV